MNQFRTAYQPKLEGEDFSIHTQDADGNPLPGWEVITEQHHKKFCDVNHILRQYDKTGLLTHINNARAHYGDFTQANEYREALDLVIAAQDAFQEVPSAIRKRFGNDPGEFMEFVTNPENADEARKMGLLDPLPVPQAPIEVIVTNPASEPV